MNENQENPVTPESPIPPKTSKAANIVKIVSILIIIASLVVIAVFSIKNSLTQSEYDQIEMGMTYDEVCEIAGCQGELSSSYGSAAIYTFKGPFGFITGGNAVITFSNGRVEGKASVGLIF